MALTLTNDITATQTTFDVTGSDALNPGDLKTIGSENIEVRTANRGVTNYGETAYWRVNANRGSLGTTKAAHAAGVAVTTATFGGGSDVPDPSAAPDGQVPTTAGGAYELAAPAGGVQTVTLLGPFTIAWDDAGLGDTGLALVALDEGALVFAAWMEVVTPWTFVGDVAGAFHLGLLNGPLGDYDNTNILNYAGVQSVNGPYADTWSIEPSTAGVRWTPAHVLAADVSLYADVTGAAGAAATAGESFVYALIATPA